jgi:hypothetical protein
VTDVEPGWGRYVGGDGRPRYRYCASLRLSHPSQDPAAWTRELELEPKTVDVAGQPRIRGKREYGAATCSFWVHELQIAAPSADFESFLEDVALRLGGKTSFFQRFVADGGEAELFIGYFLERSNTGFVLPARLQKHLADLHLDLNFDIYDNDEDDHVPPAPTQPLPNPPLPSQGRE